MNTGPSQDPLIQQLQLLLTGYGYNFYSATNQARSDDLLVRERASYHLGQAVNLLTTLRGDYQRRFIPPLTRDNPLPSQEALVRVREMEEIQQAISRLESHIRGMAVPTQDRIWWRFRQEQALLAQLLSFDLRLVRESEQLHQVAEQLTPESWQVYGAGPLPPLLQRLSQTANEREHFLLLPL
ncbi:MAG TPA: hypothetical protein VFV38_05700 [Ktedonobacteraceae bacterium]|nr:hypothetical protein [Ktedonobacteraceae bacterium]